MESPSHFLFIEGATPERSSLESAERQLKHQLWGMRTALIRDNLKSYLRPDSHGLVYVLKVGICAEFQILSEVCPLDSLDEFLQDELRNETRYGFVKVRLLRQWTSSTEKSLELLTRILEVPDRAELIRRLNLGMHGLRQQQYEQIVAGLEGEGLEKNGG